MFLDEFVGDLDISGDHSVDATIGLDRAEELYEKVFFEYGDDSVAQLGGVHLACEQASNILTKVLEWGRLMSYLEQSTRYISYDARLGGRYRYYRDPDVLAGRSAPATSVTWTGCSMPTAAASTSSPTTCGPRSPWPRRQRVRVPHGDEGQGARCGARDPSGRRLVERRHLRQRPGLRGPAVADAGHPLPEARQYAELMLHELRKVIPSFLRRVDLPDRGGRWSSYLETTRTDTAAIVDQLFGDTPVDAAGEVELVDFDPDAEDKLLAAICYSHSTLPEHQLLDRVRRLGVDERVALLRAYVGERENRRHKPGRAFERSYYRFDVLSDYGAFRDMQRHRMLTIEWQPLTPNHGYGRPNWSTRRESAPSSTMRCSVRRRSTTRSTNYPAQASYAVSMAYRLRYMMQFNAREAIHMLELRSSPQGHPSYRRVALEMHR